jgi:phosphoribosyl 1,2-cyclic phosphodiesterase
MAQIPLSETASADCAEYDKLRNDKTRQIAPDLAYRQIAMVNVIFYGRPGAGDGHWTLIDTGMPGAASDLRSAAQARFGGTGRPSAIVLTHGHSIMSVRSKRWPRNGMSRFTRTSWSTPI